MASTLVLAAMALAAVFAAVGVWYVTERTENLRGAHEHRLKLAKIVHRLETDENTPSGILKVASHVADNVFDESFARDFVASASSAPQKRRSTIDELNVALGAPYGELVYDFAREFAWIALYSEFWTGRKLRQVKAHQGRMKQGVELKAMRRAEAELIVSLFFGRKGNDDGPGGMPQAA